MYLPFFYSPWKVPTAYQLFFLFSQPPNQPPSRLHVNQITDRVVQAFVMYGDQEEFDDLAWEKYEDSLDELQENLQLKTTSRLVESIVAKSLEKSAELVPPLILGGFHVIWRVKVDGLPHDVVLRAPCPDMSLSPGEKTLREATAAKFIERKTQIPTPRILCHSRDPVFGPFAIQQYVDSRLTMSCLMKNPGAPDEPQHLDPNISDSAFDKNCFQMATFLLHLCQPSFPRIGSLVETEAEESAFSVSARPLLFNMSDMVEKAHIPHAAFPPVDKTYATADEWYVAMAEMHLAQLTFQHNDAVSSEDDCRNKYVARQLFYKLAKQGRLSTFGFSDDNWSAQSKSQVPGLLPAPCGSGAFRLWCDDFRPGNVLVREDGEVLGVIDWEFTYVAPTQFALDPPWWLLLRRPERWSEGIDEWHNIYDTRLKTWIGAMKRAEASMDSSCLSFPLSMHMEQSWETGRFWLNYAARGSWAFDTVFWKYLDERFFGKREQDVPKSDLWKTRVHLLGGEAREGMESFVEVKMEEAKERKLVDWDEEDVKRRLSEVLSD